ncbi:A disintegrin and metalloproteinase with thrombospondin motifs 12 [Holothuria leucospilota]|uniref:A disintegrin and metalloproteinase with thrombospondin motifs 12 n=1 Tax=Holothuria leucospilota TaxID=206669 RepID=A0A9Q1BQJ1_HOLLE|nr:A disintegrin and metalloproteinase with thrombospondin motifs 12 [Holothuria leucospilota]
MAGSSVFSLDAPDPVTGGWSAWMDSPCSRTCGGGVIIHQRVCNNPFPSWGGAFHVREGVEFRLCNLESMCHIPKILEKTSPATL